ncbi:hypothetical protein ELY37_17125 [Vreelandella populi]|uniref:Transposase n=1 Tax=Vreelandella populi TaxID=2498858 RepID=A0A433L898_9GAMM|nr:hypothetical protein ELY37_17125 [Halomonas populi]
MIKDIVSPPQTMGRPRRDDHQMLNGTLWILCSMQRMFGQEEPDVRPG